MLKYKHALLYGPMDVRVEEAEVPSLKENEALIRVEACGVCPFDQRLYYGLSKASYPRGLGHEIAGVVVKLGSEVGKVRKGDKVTVDPAVPCGKCSYCLKGKQNLCHNVKWPIAGFSQFTVAPENNIYPFKNISFEEATFSEPLSTVLNSVLKAKLEPASDVVIIGDGPNGLLHLQVAYLLGAARVIMIGRLDERLERALKHGATAVVNSAVKKPVDSVKDLLDGDLADSVFVAVGAVDALLTALKIVKKGGVIVQYAGIYPETDVPLSAHFIHYSEVCLTGATNHTPALFAKALNYLDQKRVSVNDFVTHRYALEKSSEAIEMARSLKGFKVMITPNA